jgi:transcriptional regulator with XRE-family HTH domain
VAPGAVFRRLAVTSPPRSLYRPTRSVVKRWSQRELAERVGVSIGTINAIERGAWKRSLAIAYAISEVLGVSVLDLFPLGAFRKLTPLGPLNPEDAVHVEKGVLTTDARQGSRRTQPAQQISKTD